MLIVMVMVLQMVMVMVFTRMMLTVCWLQTAPLCLDFNFWVILSIFLFLWLLFFCLQMTPLCSTIELGISRSSQIWKIGAISQFAWNFAFSLVIHNSFGNEIFQVSFELFPPIVMSSSCQRRGF